MAKNEKPAASKSTKQVKPEEEGLVSRDKINRKIREYRRILQLTRRPTREEFTRIAQVAALGIVIIGVVGFLIYLGMVQAPATFGNTTPEQNATTALSNATETSATNRTVNATAGNVTSSANLTMRASNATSTL